MPMTEIVRAGVEMAIDAARNGRSTGEPRVVVIKPSLIVRKSTAPPPVVAA
jgi:DNA-binding LacI/PurR family transcriptional regulator